MAATEADVTARLLQFFEFLYSNDEGFVSICSTRPPARRDTFNEEFFAWPSDRDKMVDYIDKIRNTHNVYFCVNVMSVPRRKKENAIPQNLVWADLDSCPPDKIDIPPQCVIESSPNRYQAIWRLDQKIDPLIAENYSKRLAYHYADLGVDKSGHDLTQLLRVPGTYNFKYQMGEAPEVKLLASLEDMLAVSIFDALPQPEHTADVPDIHVPELGGLPSVENIIYRYSEVMKAKGLGEPFARYIEEEPASDWSGRLWRLLLLCFEVGMEAEEAFVIGMNAKTNKYTRDGRPISHLWREVLKAEMEHKTVEALLNDHRYLAMPALLTKDEEDKLPECLIDTYTEWASGVTDAVPEFHEITCAMVMSAMMSTSLRLNTSRGQAIVPNLWALILGESTLTRKTTAMDMGIDYVMDIDRDLMLASDATMEGLLSSLALRPKMVSVFYRDEVAGMFDSMNRKDYLAGMHETMTKMYDVPKYTVRRMRKETFSISEPIFIFLGGGVPDKMYSMIDETYYASGFIPRFLVVRGYADVSQLKPLTFGSNIVDAGKRQELQSTFQALYSMYTDVEMPFKTHDGQTMMMTPEIEVTFTDAMERRAAEIERLLIETAADSPESSRALPTFSRMFISMLKLTMLLAAARQEHKEFKIEARMEDLLTAAKFIQKWGRHAVDLIRNSGVTGDETKLLAVYRTVERKPGILRGQIMQYHRLSARECDAIESTLAQRMMIQVVQKGRAKNYWPIGR